MESQESSPALQLKSINSLALSFYIWSSFHIHIMTTGKTVALTRWEFLGKVMSLIFNMLYRLIIDFLPRITCLLILWLQSQSAVIRKEILSLFSLFSLLFSMKWWEKMPQSSFFSILSFKPAYSLSSFTLIKRLFHFSSVSAIRVVSSACLSYYYFSHQSWFQLLLHPAWHFAWCLLHVS